MNFSKYAPYLIAALVVVLAIAVHFMIPNTPIDSEIETVAQEVVKDETGVTLPKLTQV